MAASPGRVQVVDAHAAGAVARLVIAGVGTASGRTLEQKQHKLERELQGLWSGLLREPRGHADMVGAVLTEPVSQRAAAGLVFFGPERPRRFSGAGLLAVVTTALERQLLVPADPLSFALDTSAGTVDVRASLRRNPDGGLRVSRVAYRAPPAMVVHPALPVLLDGRQVRVDIVWSAGWYALVDREALGVPAESQSRERVRAHAHVLAEALLPQASSWALPPALLSQVPRPPEIEIVLTGPAARPDADIRAVTVYADGAIDRSPSGGATAAVVAVLDAMGLLVEDQVVKQEGLSGACFTAHVVERLVVEGRPASVAEVEGDAWVTGEHTFYFADDDPFRQGFVI